MKQRDATAVAALRSALGAIDNAEAVAPAPLADTTDGPIAGASTGLGSAEAARRDLSEDEAVAVVQAEIADRLDASTLYQQAGKHDQAREVAAEAAVLVRVLDDAATRG